MVFLLSQSLPVISLLVPVNNKSMWANLTVIELLLTGKEPRDELLTTVNTKRIKQLLRKPEEDVR